MCGQEGLTAWEMRSDPESCYKDVRASKEGQKRKGESEAAKARVKEGISEPVIPEVGNRAQGLARGRGGVVAKDC